MSLAENGLASRKRAVRVVTRRRNLETVAIKIELLLGKNCTQNAKGPNVACGAGTQD